MFYKSKYDVIEKESFTSSMNLLFLAGKIAKDMKAYKAGKMDEKAFESSFNSAIDKGIPSIKTIAHVGYENSKDISKIKKEVLYSYMAQGGISAERFRYNYNRMIDTYIKIILAFGILEKENLDVYKIVTPEVLLGLIKSDFSLVKEAVDKSGSKISVESKTLMDKLVAKGTTYSDFSVDERKFLSELHNNYMKENILPKVTKESTEEQVLKFSKSLGKKKSVLEL